VAWRQWEAGRRSSSDVGTRHAVPAATPSAHRSARRNVIASTRSGRLPFTLSFEGRQAPSLHTSQLVERTVGEEG
jgi:hypothetical protein